MKMFLHSQKKFLSEVIMFLDPTIEKLHFDENEIKH